MGDVLPFDPSRYKAGFEPEEIPLSDIEVTGMAGITRRPWVGESVWVEAFLDPDDEMALMAAYQGIGSAGDDASVEAQFTALCEVMSRIIHAWTLTDKHGEALPQPYRNPDAFRHMPTRLMFALITRLMETGRQGGTSAPKGGSASGRSSPAKKTRPSR